MKKILLVILFILCITGVSQSQWFESGDGGLGDLDTTRIAFFDKDGTFAGTMTFTDSIIVVNLSATYLKVTAQATLDSLIVTTIATIGKTLDVTGTSTYGINTNKLQVDTLLEGDGENGISTNTTFKPTGDDQCDLGSTALAWRDIHTNDIFVQDTLTSVTGIFSGNTTADTVHTNKLVLDNATEWIFGTDGTDRVVIDANGDISPILDGTYDNGLTDYRWNKTYTDSLTNTELITTKNLTATRLIDTDSLKVSTVFHAYGGFQDSACAVTISEDSTWTMITSATNSLWGGSEATGLSLSKDTMTIAQTGDYEGMLSITFLGTNANDYEFRVYNVTQTRQEGFKNGATISGENNYVNVCIPLYFENTAGDRYVIQVQNLTGGNNCTFKHAQFLIKYLHE